MNPAWKATECIKENKTNTKEGSIKILNSQCFSPVVLKTTYLNVLRAKPE